MPLFPSLGPEYLRDSKNNVLSRMESFYADSITINQSFWGEAAIDTRFEAGDQTVLSDLYGSFPINRRQQFHFNRIRRITNMISGHQRRNRKSTIVVPVENGDQETADQFSKILMWINQQEGVLETISESFHGSLVTGMNLMHVWMDYRKDPISGNVRVSNCPYNSFLIDPFFRKTDLSDCNGIWKRSFLSKKECLSLLPDYAEEIESIQEKSHRDGKFEFTPESFHNNVQRSLTYDEFWYRDFRLQRLLVDTQTGETLEWNHDDEKLQIFLARYPQITVLEHEIPTVKLAIVVQGCVFYDDYNPMGIDAYPFVPVLAYYNPQIPEYTNRIQGVVRGLRDAQYLYNRRKTIELDILESQLNSGWKFKENALVDPKSAHLTGQGRSLILKEEAVMTDVEQINPPQIPASMMQMSELLAREVQEISGVNEELLGSAIDDKAGILSMLRQGAGLTTLQSLFDQLDYSQKLLGRLIVQLVQANFTPGKVKRITEQEPRPEFYNKMFGTYDAAIEEGFNTTTQRQVNFAQLLQLRQAGVMVPDAMLLEAATVQNKTTLIKAVEDAQNAQAEAQRIENDMQLRLRESQIKMAESAAEANEGLGMERASRVMENRSQAKENEANAIRNRETGLLNLVKAIKEIEDMDLKSLERMIKLSASINKSVESGVKESEPMANVPTPDVFQGVEVR